MPKREASSPGITPTAGRRSYGGSTQASIMVEPCSAWQSSAILLPVAITGAALSRSTGSVSGETLPSRCAGMRPQSCTAGVRAKPPDRVGRRSAPTRAPINLVRRFGPQVGNRRELYAAAAGTASAVRVRIRTVGWTRSAGAKTFRANQRRRGQPTSHSRTIVIVAPRAPQSVQRTATRANSSSASSPCFLMRRSAGSTPR